MTNPLTNVVRAERAKEALAIYTMLTSSGAHPSMMNPVDLESAVIDLMADLLHYGHRRGFDAATIARLASDHFEAELTDEEARS